MKRIRPYLTPLLIFLGLAFAYRLDLGSLPIHPAEVTELALSRVAISSPLATDSPDRLLNDPLTPLVVGLSWLAHGYTPDQIDASPTPGLLAAARTGPAMLTALAAAFLFWIGWRLGGWPTGLLAAALFAAHPLILLDGRRALSETVMTSTATLAAASLLLLGRDLHRAWRRQRDAAVAFEVEPAGPPMWDSAQMRIETAAERERNALPDLPQLTAPDRRRLPSPQPREIIVVDPERDPVPSRRVVMPSPVAAPRWQASQMRVGTAEPPEPIPGSTRPGHRLAFETAWRAGWPAALLTGLAIGLSLAAGSTGLALLLAALVALAWIVWPRIQPGRANALTMAALGALILALALLVGFASRPALYPDPIGGLQTLIRLRQEAWLQQAAGDPATILADPLARAQAMARQLFFEAPRPTDSAVGAYVALPWTGAWPQPWAGIVGLSAFGLGVAAAIRRSRQGAVAAIVSLAWLGALVIALSLSVGLDQQRAFLQLLAPASLLAAYGVTALIEARGDLRELGRR